MPRKILTLAISLVAVMSSYGAWAQSSSFLDNGIIKVGVDLKVGGSIYWLSTSGGANQINIADKGRYVQQSYYSGPQPYGSPSSSWPNWPWNPIQVGDCYGNSAKILAHTNDGKTIYTKSIGKQWALNNVDQEGTLEQWTTIDGSSVNVYCRINNARPDTTWYGAFEQEKPAVYTVATLYKLYSYNGNSPFTNGAMNEVVNQGPPWNYWTATENWAAQVDASGWGVGTYKKGSYSFVGGFAGTKNSGGPTSGNTGYIAPLSTDILDHNITYDFEATLILGSLSSIRSYVYSHAPNTRPNFTFAHDRQNFTMNGTDTGFPWANRRMQMKLDTSDPYITSPPKFFAASSVPKLYIRMALAGTNDGGCQIFFAPTGGGFSEANSVRFTAIADGQMHNYAVTMSSNPNWTGNITRIRLDPSNGGVSGARANIVCINSDPIAGSVTINADSPTTTNGAVSLALDASSQLPSGVVSHMRFSTDEANWSAWEPYASSKLYDLGSVGGIKVVYAQFKDNSGNISGVVADNIVLDTVLWSDGFESNNLTAGGWTNSGATTQSSSKYMQTYTANLNSTDSITKPYSTVAKHDIIVEYARQTSNGTSSSHLIAEWFDGSVWSTLEDQAGNSAWSYKQFALPAGASNNPNFKIRFRTTNTTTAYAYIDNVVVRGIDQQTNVIINPTVNYWDGSLAGRTFSIAVTGVGYSKSYTATTLGDGTLPLGVLPQQALTIEISARPFLRRRLQLTPSGSEQIVPITLLSGDADGDGRVNLFDYVELDIHFNTNDPLADMDGTGSVNLFDYVVLNRNFGAQGD